MSKNILQVYTANPITTNQSTDLMYFGQSPYGLLNYAGMTFANFAAQFAPAGSGSVTSGTANQLAYYAASGTTVSGLATANNGVLITNGAGVPSISSTLPSAVQGNITTLGTVTSGTWNATILSPSYGGTGNSSFTAYSLICAGTTPTGAFQNVASVGTSGQILTSNGAGALPTFQNSQGSGTVNSGTANQLAYYASNGTTVSGLGSANSASLVTNSAGVPAWSSTMTNGQVIIGSTGATPTAATLTAGTNITITNAANSITISTTAATSSDVNSFTLLMMGG